MNQSQPILQFDTLKVSQGSFRLEVGPWTIAPSELVLLAGPNGAGKTTFMEAALGVRSHEAQPRDNRQAAEFSLKRDMAYVPTVLEFFPSLRGRDVASFLKTISPRWNQARLLEFVQQWNLPLERKLKTYSFGEKRKLYLALALCRGAKLIVLDEPLAGLDPQGSFEFVRILREVLVGKHVALWVSSNVLDPMLEAATRVDFMDRGHIRRSISGEQLSNKSGRDIWEEVYA